MKGPANERDFLCPSVFKVWENNQGIIYLLTLRLPLLQGGDFYVILFI